MNETTFDFNDGLGEVPAHQHPNGGGWVADSANVEFSAYVSGNAWVSGNARVYGNAQIKDTPLTLGGLPYYITIYSGLAQVGCQLLSIEGWRKKTEKEVYDMDGEKAKAFYPKLISIFDALGV